MKKSKLRMTLIALAGSLGLSSPVNASDLVNGISTTKIEKNLDKEIFYTPWQYNSETKKDERTFIVTNKKEERKHVHQYTKFVKFNKRYEYKKCACGKIKTQKHTIKMIKENANGSKIYDCTHKDCAFKYIATNTKNVTNHTHRFVKLIRVGKIYEFWQCSKKNCLLKARHIFKKVEVNDKVYNKCTNPKCNYKRLIHTHKYLIDSYDKDYEYLKCQKDGKVKKQLHDLIMTKEENGDVLYTCQHDGCNLNYVIKHQHEYSKLARVDDNYEYWQCPVDNEIITKNHNLINTTKDGKNILMCTNDGCNYYKELSNIHTHNYTKLVKTDDNYEYWQCESDEQTITKPHNFQTNLVDDNKLVTTCTNKGCTYHKEVEHTHDYSKLVKVTDELEYWQCEADKKEITKAHNFQTTKDENYNTIITCSNIDCTYHKEIEHTHDYQTFVDFDENYEHYQCECGNIIDVSHNLSAQYYDFNTGLLTEDCQNPNCDYKKTEKHEQHNWLVSSLNDDYEQLECSICKYQTNRQHNYDYSISPDANCTYNYPCLNDGCNHVKTEVKHNYTVKENIKYNGVYEDKCQTVVYSCSNCNDTYQEDIPHTLKVTTENELGKIEQCQYCPYEKLTFYEEEVLMDEVFTDGYEKPMTLVKKK